MNTEQLLEKIGPCGESRVIIGRYGDATLHIAPDGSLRISCDPCYLGDMEDSAINASIRAVYPDIFRDARKQWRTFGFRGRPAYYRTCSDGSGWFGNSVDSGLVVVVEFISLSRRNQVILGEIFGMETQEEAAK